MQLLEHAIPRGERQVSHPFRGAIPRGERAYFAAHMREKRD